MTNNGDDCYFYYYSTCAKGDKCPFRHCEAAMGNEVVCNLWEEGRCFRDVCKYRHMEITKKRKAIQCYWETHPSGCQKPHCAFYHERPRFIEGALVPPDKLTVEEEPLEEPPAPLQATPLPAAVNPQLRGVKTEPQEPVPSPTHPPVVINPVDDDEDEDDQYSEGEDSKFGPSPRKMHKLDGALNFGVSTLEEIKLRKALKSNMMGDFSGEWTVNTVNGKGASTRGSVIDRLGKKLPTNVKTEEQMRRSLAERLGKVMSHNEAPSSPQPGSPRQGEKKVEEIRIKTLDEIKKEKAAKNQDQNTLESLPVRGVKRAISVKEQSIEKVKRFSEIIQTKKRRKEEKELERGQSPTQSPKEAENTTSKTHERLDMASKEPVANKGELRVKTLEEIRREKAARIQAQLCLDSDSQKAAPQEQSNVKKPRLLSTKKTSLKNGVTTEKSVEDAAPPKASVKSEVDPAPSKEVKVKTFEEIMREKSLRRQELAGQSSPSNGTAGSAETRSKPLTGGKKNIPDNSQSPPTKSNARNMPTSKMVSPPINSVPARAVSPADLEVRPSSPAERGPVSLLASKSPLDNNRRNSPELKQGIKVRPKLNVKPSVVKPALHVRPGSKRKAVEHSAVAAIKPLSSSPTMEEETTPSRRDAKPSSGTGTMPVTAAPLMEKADSLPVSLEHNIKLSSDASRDTSSSSLKSPTQSKTRRQSMSSSQAGAAAFSATDDFEDLLNEFADSEYEEDADPGIGEDDLLQELSDMIDS